MLPAAELQARIAAEFLRVGASQQSWDQNFPTQPSTWVQHAPNLPPTLSAESRETYEDIAGEFFTPGTVGAYDPDPEPKIGVGRVCLPPTVAKYFGQLTGWLCVLPDGALVTTPEDEEDFPPVWGALPGQRSEATNPVVAPTSTASNALPPFVGGRLGKVLYTPIANRNLNGVRVGTLPRVVMGDVAPPGYGTMAGVEAGGGSELIQP